MSRRWFRFPEMEFDCAGGHPWRSTQYDIDLDQVAIISFEKGDGYGCTGAWIANIICHGKPMQMIGSADTMESLKRALGLPEGT